jgi:hypothetical protein
VAKCEFMTSAEYMLATFPLWDIEHAIACMEVIENVCRK